MSKPNLIILTTSFPGLPSTSEVWLKEELEQTSANYNKIMIVPFSNSKDYIDLPKNCKRLDLDGCKNAKINLMDFYGILRVLSSEIMVLISKRVFLKEIRYSFALIKNLYSIAKFINTQTKSINEISKVIVYAYWADNLATCAAIMKMLNKSIIVVTRAHSYEIYEEQTKHGFIPFRLFQLKYVDRTYTDSHKGYLHLINKHPRYKSNIEVSYVGVNDYGINPFSQDKALHVVTCSFVREQKRLYLMPEILKHVKIPIVWHLIGDGPDLEAIKKLNDKLPDNVNIKYLGYYTNEQVINYYKTVPLDLFMSVSSIEGLPVTLIEAISFGLPLLSTDVGGCNEICNERTGILIDKNFDPSKVAELLTQFKSTSISSESFRKSIKLFWRENFQSNTNYQLFSEKIIKLSK